MSGLGVQASSITRMGRPRHSPGGQRASLPWRAEPSRASGAWGCSAGRAEQAGRSEAAEEGRGEEGARQGPGTGTRLSSRHLTELACSRPGLSSGDSLVSPRLCPCPSAPGGPAGPASPQAFSVVSRAVAVLFPFLRKLMLPCFC